jgi:hypothetical protein
MKKIYHNELSPLTQFGIEVFAKEHNLQKNDLEDFLTEMLQIEYQFGSFGKSDFCEEIRNDLEREGYDNGYFDGVEERKNKYKYI